MTEPSQYFKGRTVQEQMDEVIGYVDTRAAEVATAAIASDVAQVHQDMLDADADASAAAASAAAAAGTLANAVKKTGEASQSIAGDIAVAGTLSGGVVTGTVVTVPTPVNNTDAASKKYVDDKDALDVHLAGSEAITGAKTVPLEATGTFSNQIASSNKVKNEMDNYAPMLRTSGNQVFSGIKKAGGTGFFRKQSPSLNLASPNAGTVTDEVYAMEDVNGSTVISNFNSYTENAQTIYQISTKYPFEEGGVVKVVTGAIWMGVYKDRLTLFIRYTDKNGTAHLKTIASVSETDP